MFFNKIKLVYLIFVGNRIFFCIKFFLFIINIKYITIQNKTIITLKGRIQLLFKMLRILMWVNSNI